MIKIQLCTRNAQLQLENKIIELPEAPIIGDNIYFANLFNEDEIDTAEYESSKQNCKLEGKVIERLWYLDIADLEYKLLLTLELSKL